jgi:tRNA(fMet)-specific endonuclease VapC
MALRFLLDTNVVSELTKAMPSEAVIKTLLKHEPACAIGAPTLEELTFGCARLQPGARQAWFRRWLDGLMTRIAVLPYDMKAALWLGQERARLAGLGRPAPRTDGEIAAVAVTNGLTLVTRNGRDFEGFFGLSLEDWHAGGAGARG